MLRTKTEVFNLILLRKDLITSEVTEHTTWFHHTKDRHLIQLHFKFSIVPIL